MPEFIDSEGNFTQEFKAAVPEMIGKDHPELKTFDTNCPKSLAALVKFAADNKSALGKKLENVIQIPPDNADDKTKSEFTAILRKQLGIVVPETPDKYDVFRPTGLPEGMAFRDDILKEITVLAHKHGVSNAFLKEVSQKAAEMQIAGFTALVKAQQEEADRQFNDASAALKDEWRGDDLVKNSRIAYKAYMELIAADDLKKLLTDNKIYENAGDLTLWRKCGIDPYQLKLASRIGSATLSASVLKGDTSGAGGDKIPPELKKRAADYPPKQFRDLYTPEERGLLGVE